MKKILFEENKNIVGPRVRELRRKLGLSQGQLAARMQVYNINMDQQMISRIENNMRFVTDYEFACFCLIFKAEPRELLSGFYDSLSAATPDK